MTTNVDVVRDATPVPPNAPDPNVVIPAHVRAAGAAAEALHKQLYTQQEPAPVSVTVTEKDPSVQAPEQQPELPTVESPPLAPEPAPQQRASDDNITAEEWRRRFLSMQGRYTAQVKTHASMEEQMRQLGAELVRTQQLVNQQPRQQEQTQHNHENLITQEDREHYGDELIDLARRSALSALTPEIMSLRADNQRLTQQVSNTSKRELFGTLDRVVPNWREINKSLQFKTWLALPNVYTSQIRQKMLDDAVNGAQAPKVIALLRDFLAEATATGQTVPTAQAEQRTPQAAPRTPALDLETLAAPGRARPASGDSQVPVEKPIYSRAQISKFYDDKRRGYYAGRDAEVVAFETDLSAAQREGRIR